ncbi:MAG TPA: hypothetical protein VHD62_02715 [Opitutaceae bacterium]|nr:hypothetical protein [Opitutaceae bacterium]
MTSHLFPTAGRGARLAVVTCLALFVAVTASRASLRWATLEAIHQLENPHNVTRPGPCGELGAYQFRFATWRMHTKAPFASALDRRMSDIVAVSHYEWLKRGLEQAHLAASPYNIALAWNGGLDAVIAGKAPGCAHDYASRVVNLVGVFAPNEPLADAR